MLTFSDISIKNINYDLLKNNLGIASLVLLLYAFYMSIVVGSWIYFLREIFGAFLPPSFYNFIYHDKHTKDENLHWNYELKDIAIKYNNSVLYDIYKKNEDIEKKSLSIKIISVSIVLLFLIDCLYLLDENKIPLIKLYIDYFIKIQNTFYFIIHFVFLLLISLAILIPIFTNSNFKKVYLKKEVLDFIEKENTHMSSKS